MRFNHIIFLIALCTLGCDSDEPKIIPPPSDPQVLIVHNKWRSRVGVADLEWSADLADKAKALIDDGTCVLTKNTEGLGQNSIFDLVGSNADVIVDSWANIGFQYYIYDLDSCTFQSGFNGCNSYKQIIWANSTFVGCASAACFINRIGTTIWVCLYDPPGNIPGEKPY